MKRFVKRILIGSIAVFVLLVLLLVLVATESEIAKSFFWNLGRLSGEMKLAFTNNSTLKINYSGVLDEDGNIAAPDTSIPISAKTLSGGYDFGVIGSLSNGTLSIVLPPVPKDSLEEYEGGIMLGRLYFDPELALELGTLGNDNYSWIDFWFVEKPTVIYGMRFVKGWNFFWINNHTHFRSINLNDVYERGFKWIYCP
jgi:hypothetical protein